ncbi:hypothetical protein GJ496_011734 [Pomphorhynchus laevis]|nr:hypothetical protein GJ496_011734 [Pomphorhynchus laevis]
MKVQFFLHATVFSLTLLASQCADFSSNKSVVLSQACVPFAFADFDADKIIEIYCAHGNEISIIKFNPTSREISKVASTQMSHNYMITGMLAVDLDSDSMIDTVVFDSKTDSFFVFWGNNDNLSKYEEVQFKYKSWPIVTSIFENSIELFGCLQNKTVGFLSFLPNRSHSFIPFNYPDLSLDLLSTQAFVDLTGDLVADLFLTLSNKTYQIWKVKRYSDFSLDSSYQLPDTLKMYRIYPSVFLDVDAVGVLNQVVPICLDNTCNKIDFMIRKSSQWSYGIVNQTLPNGCRLVNPDSIKGFWGSSTPLVLKVADLNLDNYPDLLGICENGKGEYAVVFFMNILHDGVRKFVASEKDFIWYSKQLVLAAFFDLEENGFPDLLVCKRMSENTFELSALENSGAQDAYFFKVMVVGGGCRMKGCSLKSLPRGDNQVGTSAVIELTNKKGQAVHMIAAQSVQSDLPSFIEHVLISVGNRVPANSGHQYYNQTLKHVSVVPLVDMVVLKRTWSQMIPNSQILVVPYPFYSPDYWHASLFINPSRLIFYVGITLAVLCVIVLSLVIALQVKEKQEDDNLRKATQQFRCDTL